MEVGRAIPMLYSWIYKPRLSSFLFFSLRILKAVLHYHLVSGFIVAKSNAIQNSFMSNFLFFSLSEALRIYFLPGILRGYDDVRWCRWFFFPCAGHSVGPFNLNLTTCAMD